MPKKHLALLPLSFFILTACSQRECFECPPVEVVNKSYVHKYGVCVPEDHWQRCGKTGQVISNLQNGVICVETYQGGVLDGETTYTFPFSNDIECRRAFSHNRLIQETIYWRNGRKKTETVYKPPHERLVEEWYENGNKKSVERYSDTVLAHGEYFDLNQRLDSKVADGQDTRTNRDIYGQLISSHSIKAGKVSAETTYYPNGMPKAITPLCDNVIHGERKTFLPGGEPCTIETWVNGKQHGITTVFRDGDRESEVPYVNGVKSGIGHVYSDGQIVVQDVTWKDDLMHGPCVNYSGDLTYTDYYWKGKKVSKAYWEQMNNPAGPF